MSFKSSVTKFRLGLTSLLAAVARPAAEGAVAASILTWGVPRVTMYFRGSPMVLSMTAIIGGTIATVAMVEGIWWVLNDETTVAKAQADAWASFGRELLADEQLLADYALLRGKSPEEVRELAAMLISGGHVNPLAAKVTALEEQVAKLAAAAAPAPVVAAPAPVAAPVVQTGPAVMPAEAPADEAVPAKKGGKKEAAAA